MTKLETRSAVTVALQLIHKKNKATVKKAKSQASQLATNISTKTVYPVYSNIYIS